MPCRRPPLRPARRPGRPTRLFRFLLTHSGPRTSGMNAVKAATIITIATLFFRRPLGVRCGAV
jgi:hypothetical protein